MKNTLFVLILCVISSVSKAQDTTFNITSSKNNEIVVEFNLPEYQIVDTMIIDTAGIEQYFNRIVISNNSNNKWYDDESDRIGMPQLPILSFDLNIPYNATDVEVSIVPKATAILMPSNSIFPKQEDCLGNNCTDDFFINNSFYNSNSFFPNNNLMIDDYIVFGERGLTVSFMPFRYNPQLNIVNLISSASIIVTFTSENNRYSNCRNSYSNETYFENYFINYTPSNRAVDDNYLIITPNVFLPLMNQFKEYKRQLGYNVNIVTTNVTGTSAYSIKTYLKNLYSNQETRPDYVLLVGNTQYIPASAGTGIPDTDNPISDIEYSLFDGDDHKADVFIGRFPVSNSEQLKSIINKSIIMELSINSYEQKVTLISGHGDGADEFKKYQDKAKGHLINEGYYCRTIYATEGGSLQEAIEELDKRNIMYVFRGHGSSYGLNICNPEIDCGLYNSDVNYSTPKSYPICISVACSSGNYAIPSSFGNNWITSDKGGIAFFGATVNTFRNLNNKMHKKIFKNINTELTLSKWINLGLKKFHNAFNRRKLHIRAYNLLGDPSIKNGGIEYVDTCSLLNQLTIYNNININMNVSTRMFQNNNQFIIQSGASVHIQAGDEVIISDGFYAAEGSDFLAEITSSNSTRGSDDDKSIEDAINKNLYEYEEVSTTSVLHKSLHGITIYPNPTDGMFNVSFNNPEERMKQITLTSHWGNVVVNKENPNDNSIDMNNLSSGLYIVKIISDKGNVYFDKVIKK